MIDLFFFLVEILLTVLFAARRGDLGADDAAKGRKQPVPDIAEEALEFVDCALCGKPNPVEYVFCKACGELQQVARS